MSVLNIHERALKDKPLAGLLIDRLASRQDRFWPRAWPPLKLDGPLGIGAKGGHGPIRYTVSEYNPGQSVCFVFTGPSGFNGGHRLDLIEEQGELILRHTLAMRLSGIAHLTWPFIFRPLHDALIEDGLAQAEAETGLEPQVKPWSPVVRFLRMIAGARTKTQPVPQRRPRPDQALPE